MISDLIHDVSDKANKAVVNDAKSTVDDLQKLLVGAERTPIDLQKERAQFVRGTNLASPFGGVIRVPVAPVDAKQSGDDKSSRADVGKAIEFIHFGRVHHDAARSFDASAPVDDAQPLDEKSAPGRAPYYRAALQREAVLLASFAKCVAGALAEKERQEGSLGDLMKVAADVLGGAPGTAGSAASADMKPFLEKIEKAWKAINRTDVAYADIHGAGIKLHEVRASLTGYLLEQLGKKGAAASAPGLLSHLPLVGDLTLPGPIGDIVGMFRKVGGKLHDVSDSLIFGLTVAMQPAIEKACHDIGMAAVREKRELIYPVWYAKETVVPPIEGHSRDISHLDVDDPMKGDLTKIAALRNVNSEVHSFFGDVNRHVNKAVETPTQIIDFLSKTVKPAPGHRYLDLAFQASTGQNGALGGSEKLGEIAVTAFYSAVASDVPAFMHGFVETFVEYVFAVCVEFLRAVYRTLCGMAPDEMVATDEMVAAGCTHVLTHLVDFATSKLGLDELIQKHTFTIPDPPKYLPKGIDWNKDTLSAAPIAAKLKELLLDKAAPYLKPVVSYAMSGLATRLNAQRSWAGKNAMTMEAHLGQLPAELALLFRDLFKPLWSFLTDTCEKLVSDAVAKALGPAAKAVGIASDGLGIASGFIADAQKKATQAEAFARKVEDRAKDLVKKLSSVKVGIGDTGDLSDIDSAARALKDAVTSDPFAGGDSGGKGGDGGDDGKKGPSGFPADRVNFARGKKIEATDLLSEATNDKWKDAVAPDDSKPAAKGGDQ